MAEKRKKQRKKKEITISGGVDKDATLMQDVNVKVLEGHESEVFVCAWNPVYSLLATGYDVDFIIGC